MAKVVIPAGTNATSGSGVDDNVYEVYGQLKVSTNLWKPQSNVTVFEGGTITFCHSSSNYIHVEGGTFGIGEAGDGKGTAYIQSDTPASLAILYAGRMNANNADITVYDFGIIGTTNFTDSEVTVKGVFAIGKTSPGWANSSYWYHTMTRTTVTVDGKNTRNDPAYFSATGNQVNNLTMNASTITFEYIEGTTNVAKTTIRQLTMTNGSHITVAAGLDTIIGRTAACTSSPYTVKEYAKSNYTCSIDATSSLTAKGNLRIDESYATLALVAGDKDTASVFFGGSFVNNGTISVDMKNAVAGTKYKLIDYTGDAASAPTSYGNVSFKNLGTGYTGVVSVVDGDLYVTKKAPPVAQIGDVQYDTFADAVAAVKDGETIELLVADISEKFPAYDSAKSFTVKGLSTGTGIAGTVATAGTQGWYENGVTFENIVWTKPFASRKLENVTFKNCKFNGANGVYYCYVASTGEVTLKDCEINSSVYGVHFDENNGIVNVDNCYITSWNSMSGTGKLNISNSVLDAGPYYAMLRPYLNTTITNTKITEAFAAAVKGEGGISVAGTNTLVELNGCSVIKSKTDETVSTEYKLTDLIYNFDSNTSMVAIDGVKGDSGYTAGTFVAESVATLNAACDDSIDITFFDASNYEGRFVYNVSGDAKTVTAEGSIIGDVSVPEGVVLAGSDTLEIADGIKITLADSSCMATGNYKLPANSIILINEVMTAEELAAWKAARQLDDTEIVRALDSDIDAPTEKTISDPVEEGGKTYVTVTDQYVVNLNEKKIRVDDVTAPVAEIIHDSVEVENVVTTYVEPKANIIINNYTTNAEVRGDIEQKSELWNITVNNNADKAPVTEEKPIDLAITGSLKAVNQIIINNNDAAVLNGGAEERGFVAEAAKIELNNEGHAVVDLTATDVVTIKNVSANTLVGNVTAPNIVFDRTGSAIVTDGSIENATITATTSLTFNDKQYAINSQITSQGTLTVASTGALTVDKDSTLTVSGITTVNAGGAITVDAEGFYGRRKVVDLSNGTGASNLVGVINGTGVTVIRGEDGDITLFRANLTDLAVDDSWTSKTLGEEVTLANKTYYFGYNAFTTIQEAVNVADATKGVATINVAGGTYNENVTLQGKTNLDFVEGGTTYHGNLNFQAAEGVVLNGQITSGNGVSDNLANITIQGFTINSTTQAIYLDNSTKETKNILIKKNTITNDGTGTDYPYGIYIIPAKMSNIVVTGNTINSGYAPIGIGGYTATTGSNIKISNNDITSTSGAMRVMGNLSDTEISCNNFHTSWGIWINNAVAALGAGAITVSGNTLDSTGSWFLAYNNNGLTTKESIVIGAGNKYGTNVIEAGWANPADKIIAAADVDSDGGCSYYYQKKLYLAGDAAFANTKDALTKAAATPGTTVDFTDFAYKKVEIVTSGEGVCFNKSGAYTLTGGSGALFNYELQLNSNKADDVTVSMNINAAKLTASKVNLYTNSTMSIKDSTLDFLNFEGGAAYFGVKKNSSLTIDNSTVGNRTADDACDGPNMQIYGTVTVNASTLYVGHGQGNPNEGLNVLGNGTMTVKDSTVNMAFVNLGNIFNSGYFYGTVPATTSSSIVLDNAKMYNTQYKGDGNSRTDGIIIGDGSTHYGTLTLKNGSVINLTGTGANDLNTVTVNSNGAVNMDAASQIKLGSITNSGTITVDMTGATEESYKLIDYTGSGTMELANYGTVTLTGSNDYKLTVKDNDLYAVAKDYVASVTIGGTTTKYETLAEAMNAAAAVQDRSATNRVTVTILENATASGYDFNGDYSYITIEGKSGSKVTGDFYTTGGGTNFSNTIFKNLNFVDSKITLTTINDFTNFTIEGCSLDGTNRAAGQNPSAITFNVQKATGKTTGIKIKNNTIANYTTSATSGIVVNSGAVSDMEISGNTFNNIAHNAIQVLNVADLKVSGNTVTNIGKAVFNIYNSSASFSNNTVTLTTNSFISNANKIVKISAGNSISASDLETPLTDPKAIVQYSTWGSKDPYYNNQVIFITDNTVFNSNSKITGGDVFACEAQMETVLANPDQFKFLSGLDEGKNPDAPDYDEFTLVYVTDVANNVCEVSGPIQGTIKVPTGYTFTMTADTSIAEGTKIYVPYVQGSEGLTGWIAANIPASQAANVTVNGWVCAIGDTKYYTLSDAVTAVTDKLTIILLSNISEAEAISTDKAFSIDLNGYSYDSTAKLTNSGTITITDSTATADNYFNMEIAGGKVYVLGDQLLKGDFKGNLFFGDTNTAANTTYDVSQIKGGANVRALNGSVTLEGVQTDPQGAYSTFYHTGYANSGFDNVNDKSTTMTVAEDAYIYDHQIYVGDRDSHESAGLSTHTFNISGTVNYVNSGTIWVRVNGIVNVNKTGSVVGCTYVADKGVVTVDGSVAISSGSTGTSGLAVYEGGLLELKYGGNITVTGTMNKLYVSGVSETVATQYSKMKLSGTSSFSATETGFVLTVSDGASIEAKDTATISVAGINIGSGSAIGMAYTNLISFSESFANSGTITVDMTDATADSYKLIDYTGSGTMELANYGTVTLIGSSNYKTAVIDNDLYAVAKDYVCKIGDTKYETIQEAVNAAGTSAVNIEMIANTAMNSQYGVVVAAGQNITLDLAGYTITHTWDEASVCAAFDNHGTLVVKDTSSGTTGKITTEASQSDPYSGYASNLFRNYGTLTVESGSYENLGVNGACYVVDNYLGTATINGGNITAYKSCLRSAMFGLGDNTLNVSGGTILAKNRYAVTVTDAGAGAGQTSTVNITGGTFITQDSDYNLAFYAYKSKDAQNEIVNISGGDFTGDVAFGSKVAAESIDISGGTFCKVYSYGKATGFINNNSGNVYFKLGTPTAADYWSVPLEAGLALHDEGNGVYSTVTALAKITDADSKDYYCESLDFALTDAMALAIEDKATYTLLADNTTTYAHSVTAKETVVESDVTLTGDYTATGTWFGDSKRTSDSEGIMWDVYADTTSENNRTVTIADGTKIVFKSDLTKDLGSTATLRFGDDEPVETGATYKNVLTVNVDGDIEADQLSYGDFTDVTMGKDAEVDTKAMFQIRGNFEVDGKNGGWTAKNPQFNVGTYMNVRSKRTTGRDEARTATFKNTFITIGPSSNMADNLNVYNGANLVLDKTGVTIANVLKISENSTVTMKNGSTMTVTGHYTGYDLSVVESGSTLNVNTGSSLTFTKNLSNAGTLAMDYTATITANAFSGATGTITVDMTDADATQEYKLVDATDASSYGTISITDGWATKVVDNDLVAYMPPPMEILVCKESERTVVEGGYSYKGVVYENWAGSVSAALTLADGKSCNLTIGGTGLASGTAANPSDALIVNATTNNNLKSVTVDTNAELFVGKINEMSVVDISRFHGTGFIAAAGMVEIDKSAIAKDFTGKIGCDSTVTASSAFVSSIEGASYGNLNNNGATVYAFAKNLTIGNGKTLTGSEFLQINLNGTGFTQTGEIQSVGTLKIETGDVIGTQGQKAMEVNVTDFAGNNTAAAVALATTNGNLTGDLVLNLKNASLVRTATFVGNDSNDYTYNTNITAVVDHSQFYQTTSGAYSKKAFLTASMWNAGTGTLTQNGNIDYTVKNLEYASNAMTTMYALYTTGSTVAVNGNVDLKFKDNTAEGFGFYGVNNAGSSGADKAVLTGNLTLSVENSTMYYFYATNGQGTLTGNYTVTVTDSTVDMLGGSNDDVSGVSSITFNGADTVTKELSSFDNITITTGAVLNTNYSFTTDFSNTWSNAGTLSVDMTGATGLSYKLVDYKGTGTMTLADYGTVSLLNNTRGLELVVRDGDLYAEKDYDKTNLAVNHDWAGTAAGTEVILGGTVYYYGYNAFDNMADAAKASSVTEPTLITVGGTSAIATNCAFGGGTDVTIKGTALFNWQSDWFFIGRDAAQGDVTKLAKVTFDGAIISRKEHTQDNDSSFNISGAKKDSTTVGNGELDIVNGSNVTTEWIVNKNVLNVTDSTLTAIQLLNVAGRGAGETSTGEDATAYLNVDNSTIIAKGSDNGSGLEIGANAGDDDAIGIANFNNSTLDAKIVTIGEKGTLNATGNSTISSDEGIANKGVINFGSKDAAFAGSLIGSINGGTAGANTGKVNVIGGTLALGNGQTVKAFEVAVGSKTEGVVDANTKATLVVGTGAKVLANGDNGLWIGAPAVDAFETAATNNKNFQLIVDGGTVDAGANSLTVRNTGYVVVKNGGYLEGADSTFRNDMLITGTGSQLNVACGNLYGETGINAVLTVEEGAWANLTQDGRSFELGGNGESRVNRRGTIAINGGTVTAENLSISAKNADEENARGVVNVNNGVFAVGGTMTNNGQVNITGGTNTVKIDHLISSIGSVGEINISDATLTEASSIVEVSTEAHPHTNVVTLTGTDLIAGTIEMGGAYGAEDSIRIGGERGTKGMAAADVTVTGTLTAMDNFSIGSDEDEMAATKADSKQKLIVTGTGAVAGATWNNFYQGQSAYILVEKGATLVGQDSSVHGYIDITGKDTSADFNQMRLNGETGKRAQLLVTDQATFDFTRNLNIGHESNENRYADVTINNASLSAGSINIDSAATTSVSGSTLTLVNSAQLKVLVNDYEGTPTTGILTNYGAIKMDYTSSITVNAFSGANGTITVDMTGATSSVYKLIDNTGSTAMTLADYGIVTLLNGTAYNVKVIDNDLYAVAKPIALYDKNDTLKAYYEELSVAIADAVSTDKLTVASDYQDDVWQKLGGKSLTITGGTGTQFQTKMFELKDAASGTLKAFTADDLTAAGVTADDSYSVMVGKLVTYFNLADTDVTFTLSNASLANCGGHGSVLPAYLSGSGLMNGDININLNGLDATRGSANMNSIIGVARTGGSGVSNSAIVNGNVNIDVKNSTISGGIVGTVIGDGSADQNDLSGVTGNVDIYVEGSTVGGVISGSSQSAIHAFIGGTTTVTVKDSIVNSVIGGEYGAQDTAEAGAQLGQSVGKTTVNVINSHVTDRVGGKNWGQLGDVAINISGTETVVDGQVQLVGRASGKDEVGAADAVLTITDGTFNKAIYGSQYGGKVDSIAMNITGATVNDSIYGATGYNLYYWHSNVENAIAINLNNTAVAGNIIGICNATADTTGDSSTAGSVTITIDANTAVAGGISMIGDAYSKVTGNVALTVNDSVVAGDVLGGTEYALVGGSVSATIGGTEVSVLNGKFSGFDTITVNAGATLRAADVYVADGQTLTVNGTMGLTFNSLLTSSGLLHLADQNALVMGANASWITCGVIVIDDVMTDAEISAWKRNRGISQDQEVRALTSTVDVETVKTEDVKEEGGKTVTTTTDTYVINLTESSTKVRQNDLDAPETEQRTITSETETTKDVFVSPVADIVINNYTTNAEVRGDIYQDSDLHKITVNNNADSVATPVDLAITGSLKATKQIVINNNAGAVLNGGSDQRGFVAKAEEITVNNDGHAVVNLQANDIVIRNATTNTLTGSVEGDTITFTGATTEGRIVNAEIAATTSVTFADSQILENVIVTSPSITNNGALSFRGIDVFSSAVGGTGSFDWDLATAGQAHVNDYTYLTASGAKTITVNADQATGTYVLAENAATAGGAAFTLVGTGLASGTISVGDGQHVDTVNSRMYTLAVNSGNQLVLTVAEKFDGIFYNPNWTVGQEVSVNFRGGTYVGTVGGTANPTGFYMDRNLAISLAGSTRTIAAVGSGTIDDSDVFKGANVIIAPDGSADYKVTFMGSKISNSNRIYTEKTDSYQVEVDGGHFMSSFVAGDVMASSVGDNTKACFIDRSGTVTTIINGGVFDGRFTGGSYYAVDGTYKAKGNTYLGIGNTDTGINLTINGGSFGVLNSNRFYAGNSSLYEKYSGNTEVNGNINFTVNANSAIAFGEHVICGSQGSGRVYGNLNVTVTGSGSNLTFADNAIFWGGCSGDGYISGSPTRETISSVTGKRTLTFSGFTGAFNARVALFETLKFTDGTNVEFTSSKVDWREVLDWKLDCDSFADLGSGKNVFTGDTLYVDLTGWNNDETVLLQGDATVFEDFSKLKSVTIGIEKALWNGTDAYVSDNYKLTIKEESTKIVLGIVG